MNRLVLPFGAISVIAVAAFALRPDSVREKLNHTFAHLFGTRNPVVERRLDWTQQECNQAIERHLQTLDAFFADAKRRTPEFAAAMVGFRGKWNYIRGKHQTYATQRFNDLVFSPNDLENAIQQVVEGYLQEVQSIENQMLVRLQADIADEDLSCPLAELSSGELEQVYQERLSQLLQSTQSGIRRRIAQDIAAFIVGELATQVVLRLALSTGILGAGVASGPETLGIGIVVAIAADWVVSEIMQSEEKLAAEVNRELDNLHSLLINGGSGVVGLRMRLQILARERDAARREVIRQLSMD